MKHEVKKLLILNLPYLLFVYLFDKIGAERDFPNYGKLNTSNFSVMPDKSIHLYDYVENAGKVSALLSANNITIYQLAQSGDSLETYYTNLIGGCQND